MSDISEKSIEIIQQLVHDGFDANATLDRCKTILNSTLSCPITSSIVHKRAHNYAIEISDTIGDIIEDRNIPVNYGGIEKHVEMYNSPLEVITKVYEVVSTYQAELNVAYSNIFTNGDFNILSELEEVMELHNEYLKKAILWKDIAEKYGNNPSFDVHMKEYE